MPDPNSTVPLGRLTRRADFVRAAKGNRCHKSAFTVQVSSVDAMRDDARVGFTLTRKVGCAVVRNRARRRLKEAVRLSPDLPVTTGRDYVIVGRLEALRLPFDRLRRDLAQAIRGATETGRRRSSKNGAEPRDTRPERTRLEP